MTNPLETARKNLHKRYQLLAQDLGRVVNMLTLHEHTGFKTIQPAIDILQELIAGLTDSEKDLEHGLGLLRSTRDELCAVPDLPQKDSVHSVPYYPLDGEAQVTVIGSVDNDLINPNHYKTQSGVSCIDIAELFPYSLGNAIKYAWRAGKKGGTANDLNGREYFLKQDLGKCEWYLNRAIENGEDSLFMGYHLSVLKARRLFAKLNKADLPELNYELVSRILDGRLEYALIHIDDWLVE